MLFHLHCTALFHYNRVPTKFQIITYSDKLKPVSQSDTPLTTTTMVKFYWIGLKNNILRNIC